MGEYVKIWIRNILSICLLTCFLVFSFQRYLKDPDDDDHGQLFDLIGKLLNYEPSQRCTLRQAMRHNFFLPYQREPLRNEDDPRSDSASDRCRSHSISR